MEVHLLFQERNDIKGVLSGGIYTNRPQGIAKSRAEKVRLDIQARLNGCASIALLD